MRLLIVGAGGREHALAWKVAQSARVRRVYVAPGNAGTGAERKCENVAIAADDLERLLEFARQQRVDLTIVGPEAPLVAGIVDVFEKAGLRIFGPRADGARLEGSKAFTKEFLARHSIASAAYRSFTDASEALSYVEARGAPLVVKADGLAAGKGVTVAATVDEARTAVRSCLVDGAFGAAGRRVVIEDFLDGEEASFMCVVGRDGILPLASSQDHKARDEGDRGPNTGGMGAYSPAPVLDAAMQARVMTQVIEPTVAGLAADGVRYTGFLYAGLMIGHDGVPRVLEYNCRFGDPETQPVLMRLQSDLVTLCEQALEDRLAPDAAAWDDRVALGVVMAAGGYPFEYRTNDVIEGLDDDLVDTKVFHAGTRVADGRVVTAGGRVLCVCALGETVAQAQERAYARVGTIHWRDVYYRRDIGHRALVRER